MADARWRHGIGKGDAIAVMLPATPPRQWRLMDEVALISRQYNNCLSPSGKGRGNHQNIFVIARPQAVAIHRP